MKSHGEQAVDAQAKRVANARRRVIEKLTKHPSICTEEFDRLERHQLRDLEREGLIAYNGNAWQIGKLETFRERFEAELARTLPDSDPKLAALGAFARATAGHMPMPPAPKFTGWTLGLEVDKRGLAILKVALEAQLVISEGHGPTLERVQDLLEQLDRVRS